jgi:hypothetical protein
MSEITKALLRAFASLLHPRLLLWPLLMALALWLGVGARILVAGNVWPLALCGLIPVLGFLTPVYGGLAFIHYCLARLTQLREQPVAIQ